MTAGRSKIQSDPARTEMALYGRTAGKEFMKFVIDTTIALGLVLALSSCATQSGSYSSVPLYYAAAPAPEDMAAEPAGQTTTEVRWPRIFTNLLTTNIVYQPQIDTWDGHFLQARSAVAVQASG